jgi:hypothetical protein
MEGKEIDGGKKGKIRWGKKGKGSATKERREEAGRGTDCGI